MCARKRDDNPWSTNGSNPQELAVGQLLENKRSRRLRHTCWWTRRRGVLALERGGASRGQRGTVTILRKARRSSTRRTTAATVWWPCCFWPEFCVLTLPSSGPGPDGGGPVPCGHRVGKRPRARRLLLPRLHRRPWTRPDGRRTSWPFFFGNGRASTGSNRATGSPRPTAPPPRRSWWIWARGRRRKASTCSPPSRFGREGFKTFITTCSLASASPRCRTGSSIRTTRPSPSHANQVGVHDRTIPRRSWGLQKDHEELDSPHTANMCSIKTCCSSPGTS